MNYAVRRAPYPAATRQRRPVYSSGLALLAAGALLISSLLLPAVAALGGYAYFQAFDLILPRVQVAGLHLGGHTVYKAAVRLNRAWNMERKIPVGVMVSGEMRTWQVLPGELGLNLDPLETARRAHQVGRGPHGTIAFDRLGASLLKDTQVLPVVNFDPVAARFGLEALSAQVSVPAKDASLRIEGNQLVTVPASAGYTVDVESSLAALAADPSAILFGGSLPLALKPVEPVIRDVSAAAAEAERLLKSSVRLKGYDPVNDEHFEWAVPAETLAGWVKVEAGGSGPQIVLDEARVAEYLAGLSELLGPERWIDVSGYSAALGQAVREEHELFLMVKHRPTSYVVEPGDTLTSIGWKVGIPYWKIVEANPGLDANDLWAGRELTIPSKDEMLPLPVIPNKRVVISIGEQRLRIYENGELLSEHVISTGIDRSPTQPGVFQVQTHELEAYASVWDLYMPHFLGIYEAWPGFMNGIHGLPTLSNGRRLWADILGRPASFGCIIMDLEAAEFLYNWAEDGVIVEITP